VEAGVGAVADGGAEAEVGAEVGADDVGACCGEEAGGVDDRAADGEGAGLGVLLRWGVFAAPAPVVGVVFTLVVGEATAPGPMVTVSPRK